MKVMKALAALVLAVGAASVCAAPVTFTHRGFAGEITGSIDGVAFTTDEFVITATSDTAARMSFANGFFIDHLTAQIVIENVGSFDFITPTRTFVNNTGEIVGFSRAGATGADLFNGPTDNDFAAWDMLTSIGPIAGAGQLLQWTLSAVSTDGGQLIFDNRNVSAEFQAQLASAPEPGALLLLSVGFAALGLFRLRGQSPKQ